jgi:peroxiredoxin
LPVIQAVANGHHNGNGHQNGHANGHRHEHNHEAAGAKIGQPAPALKLPDLDGKQIDLADLRGKNTLVLFWNPGCGFCQQMLPDLKAWEASRPKNAPRLLVVSSGGVEANRALGLRSAVVLEPSFQAGYAFGVNGTPSAVLVDAQGRIASEVAVGAQAVLALARSERPPRPLPRQRQQRLMIRGSTTSRRCWRSACQDPQDSLHATAVRRTARPWRATVPAPPVA